MAIPTRPTAMPRRQLSQDPFFGGDCQLIIYFPSTAFNEFLGIISETAALFYTPGAGSGPSFGRCN